MSGFKNGVLCGKNADYTQVDSPNAQSSENNGLITNGQLWIGSTSTNIGGTHINVGTLTSPTGTITIGYSSPNITLDVEDAGFVWLDVSGAFSPLKNTGYFITGTATGTLPASPSQGDTIQFFVDNASQVLTLVASGTQIIRMGSLVTSAGGTFTSTKQGDSCELVYRAADTCWCAVDFVGTWVLT